MYKKIQRRCMKVVEIITPVYNIMQCTFENKIGYTPLILGIIKGKLSENEIPGFIRSNIHDINTQDKLGQTPLMHCVLRQNHVFLTHIFRVVAEDRIVLQDYVDNEGNTAFMNAIMNWDESIMMLFSRCNNKINICNKEGNTPLMIACKTRGVHPQFILYLCKFTTDINFANVKHETAVSIAFKNKHFTAFEILSREGANLNSDIEIPSLICQGYQNMGEQYLKTLASTKYSTIEALPSCLRQYYNDIQQKIDAIGIHFYLDPRSPTFVQDVKKAASA